MTLNGDGSASVEREKKTGEKAQGCVEDGTDVSMDYTRYIPEDSTLYYHRRESLKFYELFVFLQANMATVRTFELESRSV
jgi:hypothetical protein